MTNFERAVGSAIRARRKAELTQSEESARLLRQRHGLAGVPEVEAVLADGAEAFLQRVTRRVMSDSRDEVDLNRCPKCGGIPRTPRARQCPWCFYKWHHVPREI